MATDPFNQNRPERMASEYGYRPRRRSEPTPMGSMVPDVPVGREAEALMSRRPNTPIRAAMLPASRAPSGWQDELSTSQIRGAPAELARGRAADEERAARRNDIQARPGGRAGGGPATALIGMPEDEKMRRLQNALSTVGRGSPSTRKALIEGFYGDRQREADGRANRADNAARMEIANARSSDGFAERQLEADRFNTEQAAQRRAAQAPLSAKDRLEMQLKYAGGLRDQDTHELTRPSRIDEQLAKRRETLVAAGTPESVVDEQLAAEGRRVFGDDIDRSLIGAAGKASVIDDVRATANRDLGLLNLSGWFDSDVPNWGLTQNNLSEGINDLDGLEFERAGLVRRLLTGADTKMTWEGEDGRREGRWLGRGGRKLEERVRAQRRGP